MPAQSRRELGRAVRLVLLTAVLAGLYGTGWVLAALVEPTLRQPGVYPTATGTQHRLSPATLTTYSVLVFVGLWFVYRNAKGRLWFEVGSWRLSIRGIVFDLLEVLWLAGVTVGAHLYERLVVGADPVGTASAALAVGVSLSWLVALFAATQAVRGKMVRQRD